MAKLLGWIMRRKKKMNKKEMKEKKEKGRERKEKRKRKFYLKGEAFGRSRS